MRKPCALFRGFWQCLVTLVHQADSTHLHEVLASFTKINLSNQKKMFTKKSNGRKDFKSTAISENFMQMDVKIKWT